MLSTYKEGYSRELLSTKHKIEYGIKLHNNAQYHEALYLYKKLEGNLRTNYELKAHIGNTYFALKVYDLALSSYERANELADYKAEWVKANIGNLYYNIGLYAKAEKYLNEAIDITKGYDYGIKRLSNVIEQREANEIKEDEFILKGKAYFR
jgi:tetratricopeptide (TPR) repeat protein